MLGFTCSWSLAHFQCFYDTSNRSEIYLFFCEKKYESNTCRVIARWSLVRLTKEIVNFVCSLIFYIIKFSVYGNQVD